MTTGYPKLSISLIASSKFVYSLYLAVGILCLIIKSLENDLLPSNVEHSLFGPNILRPSFSNSSTIPFTSGTSGPTTVKSILFSFANFTKFSISLSLIFTHCATFAIPALPGAQ